MSDIYIRNVCEFDDKSFVRHTIVSQNSTRYGVIDKEKDMILYEGKEYSLYTFAFTHIHIFNPDRKSVNAWAECEIKLGPYWVNMEKIRKQ